MAKVDIVRITYKGNAPALTDVLSGQVQLMFSTAAAGAPHIKSGRLRALAVTSAQPSELAPGLPTVAASGLPGYESMTLYGVYAPAGTANSSINRLNEEIIAALRLPDVKQRFNNSGVETVGTTPEQFGAIIKADIARMGKVIKEAGIRDE
jgi:tripartite-type tricarboxylate transporter receptor subunit TctC